MVPELSVDPARMAPERPAFPPPLLVPVLVPPPRASRPRRAVSRLEVLLNGLAFFPALRLPPSGPLAASTSTMRRSCQLLPCPVSADMSGGFPESVMSRRLRRRPLRPWATRSVVLTVMLLKWAMTNAMLYGLDSLRGHKKAWRSRSVRSELMKGWVEG